jgi:hypothetical protein
MSEEKLYAKVKNGQILEVGPIPGFHENDDGTTTSGFNFLGEKEWRKQGFLPLEDLTEDLKDPETEELSEQPEYTIKSNKVQMRRAIRKRKPVVSQSHVLRQELDQRHQDMVNLRKDMDHLLKVIDIAPDIELNDLDARGLLQVLRAHRQEFLATISEIRQRLDKLEGKE